MITTISPSSLKGKIQTPPSKSSMQRACAAALITSGTSIIENFGNSNDEKAAMSIITKLGASIETNGSQMVITSSDAIFKAGVSGKHVLVNCGESGLSMRMFAPIASLFDFDITFTGEGSILTRPQHFFDDVLPLLGVEIHSNDGKLPITLRGPIQPKEITVDGSLSSQYLTGLLFAFAKACKEPVQLRVKALSSTPYIDLTLSVLSKFGYQIDHENYEVFTIHPKKEAQVQAVNYTVEADWSNAAFLLVAGAIAGDITITGADLNSTQGDKNIMNALYDCGAEVAIHKDEISIKKNNLKAFKFDATHSPDLFPPLVALASYCKGVTEITGVNRLQFKESNRALTLRDEFKKMNVSIELDGDLMRIHGSDEVKGATVFSHNDHRIAMATAVAGLSAQGNTIIEGADAVKKSYPQFYEDIIKLNAIVH